MLTEKLLFVASQIKERIRSQAAVDVDPPLSAAAQYMRQDMTREGYRHLLAVGACRMFPASSILRGQRVVLGSVQVGSPMAGKQPSGIGCRVVLLVSISRAQLEPHARAVSNLHLRFQGQNKCLMCARCCFQLYVAASSPMRHCEGLPEHAGRGRYLRYQEVIMPRVRAGSLDGLAEASRQSRVCGGAANEVMCAIFRVLMEEYGTGRYHKKHSTFFAKMMTELGLSTEPERYFDLSPWQCLASANHNFLLTERRRHYLRYNGGLTFFEVRQSTCSTSASLFNHNLLLIAVGGPTMTQW